MKKILISLLILLGMSAFYVLLHGFIPLLGEFHFSLSKNGMRTNDDGNISATPLPVTPDETITIDAARTLPGPKLKQGFVHGFSYTPGQEYAKTIALISLLKPLSWRMGSYDDDAYDFVVNKARFPQTFGTEIVFNIQDVFNQKYGWNIDINPECGTRTNCFSSYDSFKSAWLKVVESIMRIGAARQMVVHYLDIFAEPNAGDGRLGLTSEQFADTFKATYDIIRKYNTSVKIVAPSISEFDENILKQALSYASTHHIHLDALSWHEFNAPELLPAHVSSIKSFMMQNPALCTPTCPQIHINEYAPQEEYLVPGYNVGWLYYLQKAGVDQANRACWGSGSDCWEGFDGVLMPDNLTPRPPYWVYKAYADMTHPRLSAQSSVEQTVAIASKESGAINILAGKYGHDGAAGTVNIHINNLPSSVTSVRVEITRIPYSKSTEALALPTLPAPQTETIAVNNKSLLMSLPHFADGEAYSITVHAAP